MKTALYLLFMFHIDEFSLDAYIIVSPEMCTEVIDAEIIHVVSSHPLLFVINGVVFEGIIQILRCMNQ